MYLSKTSILFVPLVAAINFDWDCTNALATCNNACYAVNNGLAVDTLTYDPNSANQAQRRIDSGCDANPCNTGTTATTYGTFGNSCDEYPFASTTQGGPGAILRCVDSTENSSQGGQLSQFYPQLAAAGTNNFGLVIRNWIGAAYCQNANNGVNDGGQFRYTNNQYINARDEPKGEFEPAPELRGRKQSPRVFETETGEVVLLMTPGVGDTLVGDLIHNEQGNSTRIHRELHDFWR